MFGGSGHFGGTGGFAPQGGYGGAGGAGGNGFNGVDNNASLNEAGGGFNAVPGGGGYGGTLGGGYGGASLQQSQGLGGYLSGGGAGAPGEGQQPQGQRDSQSLVPLTLRMLLDADDRKKQGNDQFPGGPDAPLFINGREVSMFTFVATLESLEMQQMFKVHHVNDGTARIQVKQYNDSAAPQTEQELQPGEYVRVFGTLRSWNNDLHVSAHHIGRVEDPNEVPFHFIEVAHIHLSLTGKIKKALPQARPGAATQAQSFAPGQTMSAPQSFPPSFGQGPGVHASMGAGHPGAAAPGAMQHAAPAGTAPGAMSFTSPPFGGAAGAGPGGFVQVGAESGGTGFGGAGGGAFQGSGMGYPMGGGYGGVSGGMAPGVHGAVQHGF